MTHSEAEVMRVFDRSRNPTAGLKGINSTSPGTGTCVICGALVSWSVDGGLETHRDWHLAVARVVPFDGLPDHGSAPVCTDPDCTIPRKPGRPPHGPHDFRAGPRSRR